MKAFGLISLLSLPLVLAYATIHSAAEADWPQWRGPLRNGLSPDTGLLKQWPETGPKVAWKISGLGEGYGSLSMRGDRIFVQGTSGTASVVFCLNRADGKTIWQAALGPMVNESRGNGPRATPTIDGDKVFVLTENGDLASLRFRDGGVVWRKNILKEFGGSNPKWLISESPLVDGNRLIVSPGGGGASLVALDKNSGNLLWKSGDLSDGPAYSSAIAATVGGVPMYMNFTDSAAVGVRATDGKLLWKHGSPSNRTANCSTPVFADNKVFFTSAYGTGAALLNLTAANGGVNAQETYFTKEMKNHHGGVVLVNGYLYGFSDAILTCMEFATSKVMWRDRSVGKGSLTYADGMLYLLGEGQRVGLAEANPQAYVAKGGFSIQDFGKPSWAHPVVIGGKLYIRNQGELTAYNVR
jgi:outer membrane protein assembly factor BamB